MTHANQRSVGKTHARSVTLSPRFPTVPLPVSLSPAKVPLWYFTSCPSDGASGCFVAGDSMESTCRQAWPLSCGGPFWRVKPAATRVCSSRPPIDARRGLRSHQNHPRVGADRQTKIRGKTSNSRNCFRGTHASQVGFAGRTSCTAGKVKRLLYCLFTLGCLRLELGGDDHS